MYIEDIELPKTSSDESNAEDNAKIEGTGSGFVWDKLGHIVRTNKKKTYQTSVSCLNLCKTEKACFLYNCR